MKLPTPEGYIARECWHLRLQSIGKLACGTEQDTQNRLAEKGDTITRANNVHCLQSVPVLLNSANCVLKRVSSLLLYAQMLLSASIHVVSSSWWLNDRSCFLHMEIILRLAQYLLQPQYNLQLLIGCH